MHKEKTSTKSSAPKELGAIQTQIGGPVIETKATMTTSGAVLEEKNTRGRDRTILAFYFGTRLGRTTRVSCFSRCSCLSERWRERGGRPSVRRVRARETGRFSL